MREESVRAISVGSEQPRIKAAVKIDNRVIPADHIQKDVVALMACYALHSKRELVACPEGSLNMGMELLGRDPAPEREYKREVGGDLSE